MRESAIWGATVTSAGHMRTRPHEPYPSPHATHPADHFFNVDRRRILEAWQIIVIHSGSGWFESEATGRCTVQAGTTFLLFPGVWHRYAPDIDCGWTESWLEMEGSVLKELQLRKVLNPTRSLHYQGLQPDFLDAMERCHALAKENPAESTATLATCALEALAQWIAARDKPKKQKAHHDQAVRQALSILADENSARVSIHELSKKLGMAPSHFRRIFKTQLGLSPKQYQQKLRLRRVRMMLRNSDLSVTEIADHFGYNSAFHLSTEFKKETGISPIKWKHSHLSGTLPKKTSELQSW